MEIDQRKDRREVQKRVDRVPLLGGQQGRDGREFQVVDRGIANTVRRSRRVDKYEKRQQGRTFLPPNRRKSRRMRRKRNRIREDGERSQLLKSGIVDVVLLLIFHQKFRMDSTSHQELAVFLDLIVPSPISADSSSVQLSSSHFFSRPVPSCYSL